MNAKDVLIVDGEKYDEGHDYFYVMAHMMMSMEWLERNDHGMCIVPHVLKPNAPRWARIAYQEELDRIKIGMKL